MQRAPKERRTGKGMSRAKSSLHLQGTPPDADTQQHQAARDDSDDDHDDHHHPHPPQAPAGYAPIPATTAAVVAAVTAARTAAAAPAAAAVAVVPTTASVETRWATAHLPTRALVRLLSFLPIATSGDVCARVCRRWSSVIPSPQASALWEHTLTRDDPTNWLSAPLLARVAELNGGSDVGAAGASSSLQSPYATMVPTATTTALATADRSVPLHSMPAGSNTVPPPSTSVASSVSGAPAAASAAAAAVPPHSQPHHSRHSSLTLRNFLAPDADDEYDAVAAPALATAAPSQSTDVLTPVRVLVAPAAASSSLSANHHALAEPFLSTGSSAVVGGVRSATMPVDVAALIAHFRSAVRIRRRSQRRPIPAAGAALVPSSAPAPAPAPVIGSFGAGAPDDVFVSVGSGDTSQIPSHTSASASSASTSAPARIAYLRVRAQIATAVRAQLDAVNRQTRKAARQRRDRLLEGDWWAFVSNVGRLRRVVMFSALLAGFACVLLLALSHDGYLRWPGRVATSRADQLWLSVGVPTIGASGLLCCLMVYAYGRVHVRHDLYAHLITTGDDDHDDDNGAGAGSTAARGCWSSPTLRTGLLWWFRAALPVCALGLLASSCLLTAKLAADSGSDESHAPAGPSARSFAADLTYADTLGPAAVGFGLLTLVLAWSHASTTLYQFLPVLWFFGSPVRALRDRRRTAITCWFALATASCVVIALKLDGRTELGWTGCLAPVWLMTVPVTRLLFVYRRTRMERRSDQWTYTFPLFFCALLPCCVFLLLLTLQLDGVLAPFRYVYLLLPLLLPVVAVPCCQAVLYYAVVQRNFE